MEAVFPRSEATEVEAEESLVRGFLLWYGDCSSTEMIVLTMIILMKPTNLIFPEPSPWKVHTAVSAFAPWIQIQRLSWREVWYLLWHNQGVQPGTQPRPLEGDCQEDAAGDPHHHQTWRGVSIEGLDRAGSYFSNRSGKEMVEETARNSMKSTVFSIESGLCERWQETEIRSGKCDQYEFPLTLTLNSYHQARLLWWTCKTYRDA